MRKIRTILLVFLITIACFIVQTSILPSFAPQGMSANLMVIVSASYGFLFGDRKGLPIGFFCGLLIDIFFGPLIGFHAFVCALIAFGAGKFRRILYVEDLGFPLAMIAVSDLVYGFLTYVFLFLMRNRLFFREFFVSRMLPEAVLTVLAGVVVYPVLRVLYNRFMQEKRENVHSSASGTGEPESPT